MKRFLFLWIVCSMLPTVAIAQRYDFQQTVSREWTDSSGQNEFMAKLVSCDRKAGNVVLQTSDETPVEISTRDLSISDRRYLDRQMKKVARVAKRVARANRKVVEEIAEPVKAGESPLTLNTSQSADVRDAVEGVQRLYDIDWHHEPANASITARDSEQDANNDKPIVWFRVLGDLSGYM